MQKSIILKRITKLKLSQLIKELFGEDFNITSHDKEYYTFEAKVKKENEDIFSVNYYHWTEICISFLPEKLKIKYLIIPINDPDYNLPEHLINYYENNFTRINEISVKAPNKMKALPPVRKIEEIPDLIEQNERAKETSIQDMINFNN